MPTPAQLKEYADSLPPIYRDILVAFGRAASPYRRYLQGMSVDVLLTDLINHGLGYHASEVYSALEKLEEAGFVHVDVADLPGVDPTVMGEELLEIVSGKKAEMVLVPDLPKPNW